MPFTSAGCQASFTRQATLTPVGCQVDLSSGRPYAGIAVRACAPVPGRNAPDSGPARTAVDRPIPGIHTRLCISFDHLETRLTGRNGGEDAARHVGRRSFSEPPPTTHHGEESCASTDVSGPACRPPCWSPRSAWSRSEEHTSELQSRETLV